MKRSIESVYHKLIVSCQALPEEPLHSSFIMGRMAVAAKEGGAGGIRANSVEDIKEIQKNVDLPIIGIIKRDYPGYAVRITPTIREVDELMQVEPDVIAVDATCRVRPDGKRIEEFYAEIREKYPQQLLMADCSTMKEMLFADELGFDFIGTTLVGYTEESKGSHIETNDFELIRALIQQVKHPVIGEGNIDTPQKLKRVMEIGVYSVVVGSAITRPQLITKNFTDALRE
ncbi:MAG: N-acetylmannosamine-6-phosphate 2-epimerase [Firmicutes bacterium]|nr:N-acetylmannosamine-6-phosphate 2-epimerase [Bacillota bacterium]